MNDKLIKILVALAHSENYDFETELRGEVDSLGYVNFFINYINPAFHDIMQVNGCVLVSVSPSSIGKKLFVTINLNNK